MRHATGRQVILGKVAAGFLLYYVFPGAPFIGLIFII